MLNPYTPNIQESLKQLLGTGVLVFEMLGSESVNPIHQLEVECTLYF